MRAGIGMRQPHCAELMAQAPALGFVEVHAENFFGDGGPALAMLHAARELYEVSLHGVGLGLGSAAGIDAWHLDRLARLAQRIDALRVSDHAAFARAPHASGRPVRHANDLLPIAFTEASLDILVANVAQVQDRLKRPLLVENLSAYLSFADDTIPEPEFFAALCRRSGCGMLLDLNNLLVNALNGHAADPLETCRGFVDALPRGIVGEIHLAGYDETVDGAGDRLLIDAHGSPVKTDVIALYRHALSRMGPIATLIEWDNDVPAFDVLFAEAEKADAMIADEQRRRNRAAQAA